MNYHVILSTPVVQRIVLVEADSRSVALGYAERSLSIEGESASYCAEAKEGAILTTVGALASYEKLMDPGNLPAALMEATVYTPVGIAALGILRSYSQLYRQLSHDIAGQQTITALTNRTLTILYAGLF
ncbi:hypothetical protein KAR91_84190 [Candidatus Pacearchaeota archaeon]|nr:hypothetical protein [Candidatus Pacearchaeota archaeon]